MALWVNVTGVEDNGDGSESIYFHLSLSRREKGALMSEKVRSSQGLSIIEALAQVDEPRAELEDIAEAAFEMGREWERKHGDKKKKR